MKMMTWNLGRRARIAALAIGIAVPLAACSGSGTAMSADDCKTYPSEDVTLIVPYDAGGGFDAWARLLAPELEDRLGGDGAIRVENQPGGGGVRAINTTYSAPPDGTTLVFTEPGYIAVNQILGNLPDGFDLGDLSYIGQATADPQIFVVAADSDVNTLEDLRGGEINHAGQDISPIETITYDTYGIDANYILHEGTSDVVLAVERGDADATVVSLSSILPFLESGDVKPIFYIGTEKINPDLPGYEQLKGVETASETGHPELAKVLEQHRLLATAPDTPKCVTDKLSDALDETLADPEFVKRAEDAELRVVPANSADAKSFAEDSLKTFTQYKDVLEKATEG